MKYFLTITLFISTTSFASINVTYREAADIFEIMDNTSYWWPGFNDDAYRMHWERKYTLTPQDKEFFKKYKKIRDRYYNDPDQAEQDVLKNRNGFFATIGSAKADPIAEAFYGSNNLEETYRKLENLIRKDELSFIKSFFAHFKPKYSEMIAESKNFKNLIETTKKSLAKDGVSKLLSDISKFYGVEQNVQYDVLFVWWPPISRTNATPTGDYLIMRYNPIKHSSYDDTDIVMHEVVHTISRQQPLKQKQRFTKLFIDTCDLRKKLKKLRILEEPLAVANGQMMFQKRIQPKRFQFTSKWYNNAWISMYGKLIFPLVEEYLDAGNSMDEDFITKAATACLEASKAAKLITDKD
jgi:hypothetical protein